ncbi:MAG: hypothetical protein KF842_01675 [Caulobacter sp.]|nr:hypothetical protein [Caulobacter sp.]
MPISRRRLITGSAALGALGWGGLGLASPAAAAPAIEQLFFEDPLSGLSGALGADDDGYCVTAVDLAGDKPNANFLMSLGDEIDSAVGLDVPVGEIEETLSAGADEGYRLRSLCSQRAGQSVIMLMQYGGVAAPDAWYLRKTPEEYQAIVTQASRNGREPVYVSVDNQSGPPRFTVITRRTSAAWEARHNLKRSELGPLATAMKAKGLRIARSVPYSLGGEVRFCNLFRPAGAHGWEAWLDSEADFETRHAGLSAKGYVLLQCIRFSDGGKPQISAVWQRAQNAGQDLFWGN